MPDLDRDPDFGDSIDSGSDSEEFDVGEWAESDPGGRWLTPVPELPDYPAIEEGGRGLSWREWAALVAVVVVMCGVVAVWAGDSEQDQTPGALGPAPAASTTSAEITGTEGACAGLSGTVVTDRPGDPATVAGVIASFQAAYYARDVETAIRLVAPESGITREGLTEGIATIPVGTVHCVAVTPVADDTANAHIVQLAPNGKRDDYLQIVNTVSGEGGGPLISNVQRQS
ncbi:hypothetical protein ACWEKT_07535 [Nocardia takedensis]